MSQDTRINILQLSDDRGNGRHKHNKVLIDIAKSCDVVIVLMLLTGKNSPGNGQTKGHIIQPTSTGNAHKPIV